MAQDMKFPFIDLTRQYLYVKDRVQVEFHKILETQSFVLGQPVSRLERALEEKFLVKHAIAVASGTDALILSLRALDIGPGDEVITTPYSFFASTSSILLVGAKPVFIDIEKDSFNIDATEIEAAITEKTKAILPVHLFGHSVDMDSVIKVADQHGLKVIEDFAQSIGAKWGSRFCGSMGDMNATSFYPTKNLGAAGDGGLLTTNSDPLAKKVRALRHHGSTERYKHELLGTASRLDSFQGAYLNASLEFLDVWTEKRRTIARRYFEKLGAADHLGLRLPKQSKSHVWNQFVVSVPARDRVRYLLTQKGIPSDIFYPYTIPEQKVLRGISNSKGWPNAEKAAKTSLALPIYPFLKRQEQDLVIETLLDALNQIQKPEISRPSGSRAELNL